MSSRLIFLVITLLAAWLLAANSGNNLAYSLAYLLSAVLGLSYLWAWMSLRGLALRRFTRARRSQVGQIAEEQFEFANRTRLPKLWIEVEDFSTLPWHNPSRVVSNLARNTTYRWQTRTLCTQRGRYQLGPIRLRSGDPLGIFEVQRDLPATNSIVVYPPVVPLTLFEPSIANLSGGEARYQRTLQVTTNAAGVRDYMPGDSLNHIHWPTTARMRRLMTREFELDPTADIWLYLDLHKAVEGRLDWSPTPPEPGVFGLGAAANRTLRIELPPITTEYAVTAAASLCNYFVRRDRAIGMHCQGKNRVFIQPDRGERQLAKILEQLAVIEAGGALPFAYLLASEGVRMNRNDTIVAISSDPSHEWAAALQLLQRRGVYSVAIIIDGVSFGMKADYRSLLVELEAARIPIYQIRREDTIADALQTTRGLADAAG